MLYLLPNLIGETSKEALFLPIGLEKVLKEIDFFIVESPKAARQLLKNYTLKNSLQETPFLSLDKTTTRQDIEEILKLLKTGQTGGLIVDAGLPCLGDPGSRLVYQANRAKVAVETLSGPSSIIIALQRSGLYSQQFMFHGYPPKKPEERKEFLEKLPEKVVHIFIETPYRNEYFFQDCLQTLPDSTKLSLAVDLTMEGEYVQTKAIEKWKAMEQVDLKKRCAIFLLYK